MSGRWKSGLAAIAGAMVIGAVSACTGALGTGPPTVTAAPSIASIPEVGDPMPKAYSLVLSHHQVANASGSMVDGVIVIYVEFVRGLSQQEQRSALAVLAQNCADAVGVNVELTVVDNAGDLD